MTVNGCAVLPLLEVAVTDVVNGPIVGAVVASVEVLLVGGFFSEVRDAA
jgi:hypothetical protein